MSVIGQPQSSSGYEHGAVVSIFTMNSETFCFLSFQLDNAKNISRVNTDIFTLLHHYCKSVQLYFETHDMGKVIRKGKL